MNRSETIKMFTVLKAMYPQSYSKLTNDELAIAVETWQEILDDFSYKSVSNGIKAFARSNPSAFAPSPGQLVETIRKMESHPDTEMLTAEAWALVEKAARDSNYHAVERFNELPPLIQKCIGSPAVLREMGMLPVATFESVAKGQFAKAYAEAIERAETEQKIPDKLKQIATAEQQKREALESNTDLAKLTSTILKVVK